MELTLYPSALTNSRVGGGGGGGGGGGREIDGWEHDSGKHPLPLSLILTKRLVGLSQLQPEPVCGPFTAHLPHMKMFMWP